MSKLFSLTRTLFIIDKPFIDLIFLGLVRLYFEGFDVAVFAVFEDIAIFAKKHDEAWKV